MTLVLGVDGGGTHIRAVLADESGNDLGRAEADGAVVGVDPDDVVAERVAGATRAAAERAGVELPVSAMWAGLAGAGLHRGRMAVARSLGATGVAESVVVGTDVEAAFEDAFGSGPGLLLIAGTGSIAWGRDARGGLARVGGWGETVGDEGSGYAIGLAALRAVARAEDGRGPRTVLTTAVLEQLSLEAPEGLIEWASRASKGDVAALVPLVVAASAADDQVATAVLDRAAADLATHLDALLERTAPWNELPGLVLAGGLLGEGGALRDAVVEAASARDVQLVDRSLDPAMGAVRLALAGLGQVYGRD